MRKIAIVAVTVLLGACSSTGPVQIGKDTYMIGKQNAAGGFGTSSAVKADIIREASAFCVSQGKNFQLVSSQGKEASFASNPYAEINFMCLKDDDPEFARVKMKKEADTVIEIQNR